MTAKPSTTFGANGWTGGQFSLVRTAVGAYLFIHFVHLIPWGREVFSTHGVLGDAALSPLARAFPNVLAIADSPGAVAAMLVAGAVFAAAFTLGWFDRVCAVLMWYILACLFGRNPLIANPSLPFIGWMLLAYACIPGRPYGSIGAAGRTDPGGGWKFTPAIYGAAWVVMSLAYSYSGYTKLASPSWVDGTALARVLENPLARPGFVRDSMLALPPPLLKLATWGSLGLELAFAPLALIRPVRKWLWLAMVAMHTGLLVLIDFADLSAAMILFHLFVFNPDWIRATPAAGRSTLFYDGSCGLCHRAVRFVLAEDPRGERFTFAPIEGATFQSKIGAERAEALGDTIVVLDADGSVRTRSDAVIHALRSLGGLWRPIAAAASLVPRPIRDAIYNRVARVRRRLFAKPAEACPMLTPELRERFLP